MSPRRAMVAARRHRSACPESAEFLGDNPQAISNRHPIIAVTGSSGAGTSTVKLAFDHICHRESIGAIHIEGDSFHRFGRGDMQMAIAEQLSLALPLFPQMTDAEQDTV